MYEKHFGLNKRPFRAKATGSDVFVGPQTASIMAGLKKVLVAQDVVVTVAGPVGTGKTTIVGKALAALMETHKVVRIGRMQLDGNDVLDLLLSELGIRSVPSGAIQKFTAFREHLKLLEANNARLVVLVEDAARAGVETLAEIEALTAADGGESDGANIVLLGDENLDDLLDHPQLGRLRQRRRQRFSVAPLSRAELRGYLLHCFRLAGADFELVFDSRCTELVHALSGGVPRIANNLVESALASGAAAGLERIPAKLVGKVAAEEYGLTADDFDATRAPPAGTSAPMPAPERRPATLAAGAPAESAAVTAKAEEVPVVIPEPEPVAASAPEATPEPEPEEIPVVMPEPQPIAESAPAATPEPEEVPVVMPEPERVARSAPEVTPEPEPDARPDLLADDAEPVLDEADIPELIQDTLPDLAILAPELAASEAAAETPAAAAKTPETLAETAGTADEAPELSIDIPELAVETDDEQPGPESSAEDVPDWDRDPTFAELRPDFDALEQAMAEVRREADAEPMPVPEPDTKPAKNVRNIPQLDEIPEITLDQAIQTGIQNNLIDEPGEISPPAEQQAEASAPSRVVPDVRMPPRPSRKADAELERIAAELAKAKTIDDVDDRMAETLFGEEISLVAAQVLANPPVPDPANDDGPPVATGTPAEAQTAPETGSTARPGLELALETPPAGGSGLDPSASQRLKTVRALNAGTQPQPGTTKPANGADAPAGGATTPQPIEDQINTSMTQTLKALNVRPPVATPARAADDDAQEQKKGGFFGRFRR